MSKYYLLSIFLFCIVRNVLLAQSNLLPDSLNKAPDSLKMWALRHVGDSLAYAGQYISSREAFQQALDMALASGDRKAISLGYRGLGFWNEQTGDYGQAIKWYLKALGLFKELGDKRQYARTLLFISSSYDRLQDYKRALNYINQCLAIARQEQYTDLLIESYEGLAIYESKASRYQKALELRKKVLAYYRAAKDSISYYQALYNIGLLYKNMGQYTRSERAFKEVRTFGEQQKSDYLIGYANLSLPYALIPQNKLDEAEICCQQALQWVETTGIEKSTFLQEINGHLSRLWEKRGNYQKALHYYRLQTANHDSIINAERSRQVAELETRYQTREKEAEIQKLGEANAQQTRQIGAAVAGLLILAVLVAALYNLYVRVRHSRRKIQQQSDQLTLMMREIHHRVKNNLAIVSSLLYLQTTQLDDDDAIQTMRVGQQRVEAMSLIHQRLYQTDQTTTIHVRDYLTELIDNLLKAYGYRHTDFELQLAIDDLELDVDLAMPLGLILNELVTNSLKYAYNLGQHPLLYVGLTESSDEFRADLILEIRDNGPGVDRDDWNRPGQRHSFGRHLVTLLSQQLEGTFELIKQNGTLFRLTVPRRRLRM
ncbi:histidine kinase dimerization/phosphoacceptor domain -containing protein [Spirosoma sp. SC4-14]|uniref:tetratricopeptide repeat-containing sensor histidine kinase n=1 Tax=Spirosoma sp. SC4-14 TaxID=3128900 RepID=UPI0030D5C36D